MKLSEAKKKFKNQWLAFKIEKEGDDPEGAVVFHYKNRERFDKRLVKTRPSDLYTTFAGKSYFGIALEMA